VRAGDHLVHAVQRAQEGGLPAAGGADEGGHRAGGDRAADALPGEEAPVEEVGTLALVGWGAAHGEPFRVGGGSGGGAGGGGGGGRSPGGADLDVDALHGEEVPVEDVEILDVDGLRGCHRESFRVGRGLSG